VDQKFFPNAVIEQGMKLQLKSSGGECDCRKRSDEATQTLILTVRKLLVFIQG
jgi:hypothetical protein